MTSALPPAGWYRDPSSADGGDIRYWNGSAWTTSSKRLAAAARPAPQTVVQPAPKASADAASAAVRPSPQTVAPAATDTVVSAYPSVVEPPQPKTHRRSPLLLALACVSAVLIAGLVLTGTWDRLTGSATPPSGNKKPLPTTQVALETEAPPTLSVLPNEQLRTFVPPNAVAGPSEEAPAGQYAAYAYRTFRATDGHTGTELLTYMITAAENDGWDVGDPFTYDKASAEAATAMGFALDAQSEPGVAVMGQKTVDGHVWTMSLLAVGDVLQMNLVEAG